MSSRRVWPNSSSAQQAAQKQSPRACRARPDARRWEAKTKGALDHAPSEMKSPRSRSKPAFVEPMAARLIDKLPEDPEWLYELKFDGYRALLLKDGADVRILSRNRKDLTGTYPAVVAAAGKLAARQAVIDGEMVPPA